MTPTPNITWTVNTSMTCQEIAAIINERLKELHEKTYGAYLPLNWLVLSRQGAPLNAVTPNTWLYRKPAYK